MKGIKVDAEAIAEGIYKMMPEEDKTLLAFGMINREWADLLDRMLPEKFDNIFIEQYGITPAVEAREQFTKETRSKICEKLYAVAKMVV